MHTLIHDCNCYEQILATVDNGTREGLDKFLKAASSEPETVLHYEFMQDYKVCAECSSLFHSSGCIKHIYHIRII